MTSPEEPPRGDEVERVPLKVVPIFVTPLEVEPEPDEEIDDAEIVDEPAPRVRRPFLGWTAALLALATIGCTKMGTTLRGTRSTSPWGGASSGALGSSGLVTESP